MINAGDLRKRITLEKPSASRDDNGEQISWPGTTFQVWAAIEPLSSRQIVLSRSAQMSTTHIVRIRFRTDVDNTWRITWSDRSGVHTLSILGIIDVDNRHAELSMICAEVK